MTLVDLPVSGLQIARDRAEEEVPDGLLASGFRSRKSAMRFLDCSNAASLLADIGNNCHFLPCPDSCRGGASSITACALVPPIPNELTPAHRGLSPTVSQRFSSVLT